MADDVAELMRRLATLKEEKGKEYGDTWDQVDAIMTILFPKGVTVAEGQWKHWHILHWTIGKLVRFANTNMASLDSLDDLIVYLSILRTILNKGEMK